MPWPLIIVLFVIVDTIVMVLIVRGIIAFGWRPLVDKYPALEPSADAVRRNFQSFRLGLINLGYCVHVAADESHLHMSPAKLMRWFGMRTVSIPWSAIRPVKRSRNGRWTTVRVDNTPLMGPAWCLDLAGDDAEPTPQT